MKYNYIVRREERVKIDDEIILSNQQVVNAIHFANDALYSLNEQTKSFDINIFEALGMRNLSGIVGEYFAKSLQRFSDGYLHSNLHQDGYPDLLLTNTPEKEKYFKSLYTEEKGKNTLGISLFSVPINLGQEIMK